MRRRVFAGGLLLLAGCSVVLGLDPPTYDGPLPIPDASTDTGPATDTGAPNPPGRLDDVTRWSTYSGAGAGYIAGPYDGRFVYFIRASDMDGADAGLTGSRILRYDTKALSFSDSAAWTTFDPEVGLATSGPHMTAVMDGKYLVIGAFADHVFLRFDTSLPPNDFGFSSSWSRFDGTGLGVATTSYNASAPLAGGGTIWGNGTNLAPLIHRGEELDAGWEKATFDGGTFACPTLHSAVCSTASVFFLPAGSDKTACLARFDPAKPLATGFDVFDIASLGPDSTFLAGGVTSTTHLYVTQYNTPKDSGAPVRVLRRPLDGALDAGWESQPTNAKNPLTRGFVGGAFDGRFVYFAPYPAPTTTSFFARFDTTLGFHDDGAWDIAAGAALGVPANRYWGAVFDGQYVYYSSFTALGNEVPAFARFKAYDAPIALPPVCH